MRTNKLTFCFTTLRLMLGSENVTTTLYAGDSTPSLKPNVLFICTDPQHAGMLSNAGNRWLTTLALDSLAADSTINYNEQT
jgi:hypothetical protein